MIEAHTTPISPGFWSTLGSVVVRPWKALREMAHDPAAFRKALVLLLLIIGVYTLILAIFLARGYPAAAPSVLPLTVDEQYPVQIWYQGPLFFAVTALSAGSLVLAGRALGLSLDFRLAFARIAFASVIPFFFTTMIVELVLALLMLVGVVQPAAVLSWLLGDGAWFPAIYQLIAIVWIAVLFVIAAWHTLNRGWAGGILGGVLALAVHALPIALLIR
jgi:hypothetical protein